MKKIKDKIIGIGLSSMLLVLPMLSIICSPTTVMASTSTTVMIASADYTGYALQSDGRVWSWGSNNNYALGDGSTATDRSNQPSKVYNLTGVKAISGGGSTGYALKSDGTVWAWGGGAEGQLGNGSLENSWVPVQVSNLTGVIAIAGGGASGYALKSDGTVWSWGYNIYGQLGNDSTDQSTVPVQVSNLTGVTSISGGYFSMYALKSDGTAWSWGYNNEGELGNGLNTQSNVPVQVSNLTGVRSIAGGSMTGYALKPDGTVWSWGWGVYGQLGNSSNISSNIPVQVSNITGIKSIVSEGSVGYAIDSNDNVWDWGYGAEGELGNGTNDNPCTPVQIHDLTGVVSLASGGSTCYALKSDNTIWSWGANDSDQLGNNSTDNSNTPVQVNPFITLVSGITVDPATANIEVNGTQQITPVITPSDADNQNVVYSSDNTSVATVSDSGIVTAISPGTANITVEASDASGCNATSAITVTPTAPTNLTSSDITSNSATLSWQQVPSASYYNVYRDNTFVASTAGTTYNDSHLNQTTSYSYTVTDINNSAESLNSQPLSVTTLSAPLNSIPTGLVASDITPSSFTVSWNIQPNTDYYEVFKGTILLNYVANTSYSITSLSSNTTYPITIVAVSGGVESNQSDPLQVTTLKTPTPTGLVASEITSSSLTVSWDAQSYTDYYAVYRDSTLINYVAAPSYTLTSLSPNDTYQITISAISGGEESDQSSPLPVTTLGIPTPTGLVSSNITPSSFTVSWDAQSNIDYYAIYRYSELIDYTSIPSYNFTDMSPDTPYPITISAISCGEESDQSSPLSVTTLNTPPPTGLAASNITDASFTVSWDEQPEADYYGVYENSTLVDYVNATSYDFTGLAADTAYPITISAVSGDAESDLSSPLPVKTLKDPSASIAAPANLTSSNITSNSVTISWQPVTSATSYEIYRDNALIALTTDTTYNDSSLTPAAQYSYTAKALNDSTESVYSDPLVVIINASPTNVEDSTQTGDALNRGFQVILIAPDNKKYFDPVKQTNVDIAVTVVPDQATLNANSTGKVILSK